MVSVRGQRGRLRRVTLSRYGMRPDWLAEEERARDRAAANALFAGQGFTDVAQSPIRPDQLSQPDSSAFGTVSSSIGTSDTFLSAGQIGSGNILDINFDMLNSGLEARNPVGKAGFYDVIVNNFHKIQNFRQISDLFSQI